MNLFLVKPTLIMQEIYNIEEIITNVFNDIMPNTIIHQTSVKLLELLIYKYFPENDKLENILSKIFTELEYLKEIDYVILPWDIQKSVRENYPDIVDDLIIKDVLPVTITIGPSSFVHMLTLEFTVGLLLFSHPFVSQANYTISLFGAKFEPKYILGDGNLHLSNRFDTADGNEYYSVKVSDTSFIFLSTDFMQGFATGAMWNNLDHHDYWDSLYKITIDGEGNKHKERITF